MRGFQRKLDFKRYLYSVPVLLLFIILVGFFIKGAFDMAKKERESAKLLDELHSKAEVLEGRQNELERDINKLGTSEGLYEEIRGKFNVSREGEGVVIIVDPRPENDGGPIDARPWYKRFWGAIISQ